MSSLFSPSRFSWGQPDRLLRMTRPQQRRESGASDFDVSLLLQRLSHNAKLRRAHRYLLLNRIKPWAKWDFTNKAFAWKK